MAKTQAHRVAATLKRVDPMVAATLTGIIYQARLFNRQARMNIPEDEIISEVVTLWQKVREVLGTTP
jgi:hypothetical protein